jgi:hypothetical protein
MKLNRILIMLYVLMIFSILTVYAGGKEEEEEPADDTYIWDVYMEYTEWCDENGIEAMTYEEWDSVRGEMKNNPDAAEVLLAAESENQENTDMETSEENSGSETLVFATPEDEEIYNRLKSYYESLSDKEKEFLKMIIEEENM